MKVSCQVGGCEWEIVDDSIVMATAFAEVHRATNHDWVREGRCHRLELDAGEKAMVDQQLAHWREIAPQATSSAGRSRYDRSRR